MVVGRLCKQGKNICPAAKISPYLCDAYSVIKKIITMHHSTIMCRIEHSGALYQYLTCGV